MMGFISEILTLRLWQKLQDEASKKTVEMRIYSLKRTQSNYRFIFTITLLIIKTMIPNEVAIEKRVRKRIL